MSHYEIKEGNAEFRSILVGCDEGLGAFFMQCARRPPQPGTKKKDPMVWYPRLESMRELELLLNFYQIDLPPALLRQLEADLMGRPPDIYDGDCVDLLGPARAGPHLVLEAEKRDGHQRLLLLLDEGEHWVDREQVELSPLAMPTADEEWRHFEHLTRVDGPLPKEPQDDGLVMLPSDGLRIEAEIDDGLDGLNSDDLDFEAELEDDLALLRQLLETGGRFPR
jgi:hypothetical protein